ncbi:unnamed protein product [Soboliphyme baturini]|uniref:Zmiz1_N domain-containing protein n=1 Tax=Soboliphyme baturini TaxID=241478 RepID=A0A183J9V8_9BILA|nr:unnamed protein product [Soboliphyme baturini]
MMGTAYEQHVQKNNERLICIQQALRDPRTFTAAAKELLEWCLDPRAFQEPFEANLIACLNVVSQVSKEDGFDLNLGCRLLSICANYREKFSPRYTGKTFVLFCDALHVFVRKLLIDYH